MKNILTVPNFRPDYRLTNRETDVLCLLVRGLSNRQIADCLRVKFYTVSSHVKSIYKKLGVRKRSSAAALATRHGLVETHFSEPQAIGLSVHTQPLNGGRTVALPQFANVQQ